MKRLFLLAAAGALVALIGCSDEQPTQVVDTGDDLDESSTVLQLVSSDAKHGTYANVQTYEVIIENLTPATGDGASQPFSPPILATHKKSMHVFRRGKLASDELAGVAEDAMNEPLVAKLEDSKKVFDVVEGDGVILPGQSASFEIQTSSGKQRLSAVFMMVNSNDAFGGLDGARLPSWGEKVYYLRSYDAGSEYNDELAANIPGPCCGNPRFGTDTHEKIRYHDGIEGVGDLSPDTYGWQEPVAKLTVRRIKPTYEITLENITPATVPGGSQVFSPPILASHRGGKGMFRVGRYASEELAAIAEDGDTGPMAASLGGMKNVFAIVQGMDPVPPGASATYQIQSMHNSARLSMAFMLVNTNDAFSGVDRIRFPRGGSVSYYLGTYDAGSEQNTESTSDIPGPCCGNPGVGPDEHERIKTHAGIMGTGDLSVDDYGWTDPSAKLTITRIK